METNTGSTTDATSLNNLALTDLFKATDDGITLSDDLPDAVRMNGDVFTLEESVYPEYTTVGHSRERRVLDALADTEGVTTLDRGRTSPGQYGPSTDIFTGFNGVDGVDTGRICTATAVQITFAYRSDTCGLSHEPSATIEPVVPSYDDESEIIGFEISVSSSPGASGVKRLILKTED